MADGIDSLLIALFIAMFLSPAFALLGGSMIFAARSARLHRSSLARGAFLSLIAIGLLALLGSDVLNSGYTEEEGPDYVVAAWLGSIYGSLLLFGLSPAIPWLLSGLDRCTGLLPARFRTAIRELTGRLGRTSAWIALTAAAATLAVALPITAFAVMAQNRATYAPSVRPGALSVELSSPEETAAARAACPDRCGSFLPVPIAQKGGLDLTPDRLIIDPAIHRTSEAEQERLDSRLGGTITTYLEQGYRPSTTWLGYEAAAILLVLVTALVAARPEPPDPILGPRSSSDTTPPNPRRDAAARAAVCAAVGALVGATAGYLVAVQLRWAMTADENFGDPIPRVPFTTPWWLIIALLLGLPTLTAALAALFARRPRDPAPSSAV